MHEGEPAPEAAPDEAARGSSDLQIAVSSRARCAPENGLWLAAEGVVLGGGAARTLGDVPAGGPSAAALTLDSRVTNSRRRRPTPGVCTGRGRAPGTGDERRLLSRRRSRFVEYERPPIGENATQRWDWLSQQRSSAASARMHPCGSPAKRDLNGGALKQDPHL
jgi:hypothetical protein